MKYAKNYTRNGNSIAQVRAINNYYIARRDEERRAELSARGLEKVFEYGCRAQLWQFLRAKPETLARYAINAYCNREKRVKLLARNGATHSGEFATAWGELWELPHICKNAENLKRLSPRRTARLDTMPRPRGETRAKKMANLWTTNTLSNSKIDKNAVSPDRLNGGGHPWRL